MQFESDKPTARLLDQEEMRWLKEINNLRINMAFQPVSKTSKRTKFQTQSFETQSARRCMIIQKAFKNALVSNARCNTKERLKRLSHREKLAIESLLLLKITF